MNKIEKLIEEICPTGVPFLPISELCTTFSGGFIKKTKQDVNFEYPVYNGGVGPTGYYNKFNSPADSIAISGRGSIGFVNWVSTKFWAGNSCHVVKSNVSKLSNKYLYYYLKHSEQNLMALKNTGSIPALNLGPLISFLIPVPPIEVQQLIVSILDKFVEMDNLLNQELEARKKQYEFVIDRIFLNHSDLPKAKLSSASDIGDGLHGTPIYDENAEYFFINGNNLNKGRVNVSENTKRVSEETFRSIKSNIVEGKTILLSINGTIGNVALYEGEPIALGKSVAFFTVDEKILVPRYLYYFLQSYQAREYFNHELTGSTIKNLGLKSLRDLNIALPTLQEQQAIADTLKSMELLIMSENFGLPAEIYDRKKQYEYYRRLLLTFKNLESA